MSNEERRKPDRGQENHGANLPPDYWEQSYEQAAPGRLWPTEPTIPKTILDKFLDKFPDESRDKSRHHAVRFVLDAGCGDGKNMVYAAEQGFFPVGVDASGSALRQCDDYLRERGLGDETLLVGPSALDKIPFLDQAFRAAVCIDVLGHVPGPERLLGELSRVIVSGGLLYASVFHPTDGCINGPRIRHDDHPNVRWYRASGADTAEHEYYFRFYEEPEARRLFEDGNFRIVDFTSREWKEPPHLGYRDEEHTHVSWFALLERK